MKYIYYIILMILSLILQTTFIQLIGINGIKPDLIMLIIILIAFKNGENEGLFVGVIGGLLQDCFYGQYIGSNFFLYGLLGYVVGCVAKDLYIDNFITPAVTALVSTLAYEFLFYVLNILLKGATNLPFFFVTKIIPAMIYNSIFMLLVYFIYRLAGNIIQSHVRYKRRMF